MIHVVNKYLHKPTADDVYIGRGSALGNPFSHKSGTTAKHQVGTRQQAVEAYREFIAAAISRKDVPIINALKLIAKKHGAGSVNLVCFCKPAACHGDIIKEVIESDLSIFNS